MAKTALITGITGQDGSYLADLLLEKGYEVHGVVRHSSTSRFERIEFIRDRITLHEADLLDQLSLVEAIQASGKLVVLTRNAPTTWYIGRDDRPTGPEYELVEAFADHLGVEAEYVLAGETNLMNFEELSDVEKLKALFETFNRKRDLYELLERSVQSDGMQIFIGRESGHEVLDDLSIVTAPYNQGGEVVGVLGVIGPTRMEYDRVIAVVDATSKLLGAALKARG